MTARSGRGVSLLEVATAAAIVVSCAGLLAVPLLRGGREKTQIRALGDIHAIAHGLVLLEKDTGQLPCGPAGQPTYHVLAGPGAMPSLGAFGSGPTGRLEDFLTRAAGAGEQWRGPYVEVLRADPWGRAYIVNSHGYFSSSERVWVLSAGPDGVIGSDPSALEVGGDDLGMTVR